MAIGDRGGETFVVSPALGNLFYKDLARRVHDALRESLPGVELVASSEFPHDPIDARLIIVNPIECALGEDSFARRVSRAKTRIAVLAECVDTKWYRDQFKIGIDFDAVWDIGFTPQAARHGFSTPYRFVFNGSSRDEEFARTGTGQRPLPWTIVGHATTERAELAARLMQTISPGGFLFLPPLSLPSAPGRLGPPAMDAVLRRSQLYVWCAHHPFHYYESFRFRDAVLCGALPCKIDSSTNGAATFPRVYGGVSELKRDLDEIGLDELVARDVSSYLEKGPLADHLAKALSDVRD